MSKQRSFRPRNKLSFDEDDGEDQQTKDVAVKPKAVTAGASSKAPPAPIPKKDSKPSLLSFDEDGGDEDGPRAMAGVGKKKEKSSKSKFGRSQGLPELPAMVTVTQQSASGEYTADKLKELQKNALSFSSAKFASEITGSAAPVAAPPAEPLLKLSGTFKPAGLPKDDRFSLDPMGVVKPKAEPQAAAASTGPVSQAGGRGGSAPPAPTGSGATGQAQQGAPPAATEEEEEDGDDVIIPDEDTIRLAKAKRERLRQAHLAPDYVPLGGASKLLAASKGGMADTAMEEPGSGSDAEAELEDAMRLKFTVAGESKAAEKQRYARSMAADEDADAFAEEQLRKAVSRSKAAMPQRQPTPPAGGAAYPQGEGYAADYSQHHWQHYNHVAPPAGVYGAATGYVTGGGYVAGAGMGVTGGVTLAGAMARGRYEAITGAGQGVISALRDAVARLTTSHRAAQSNLTKTSTNLTNSLARIETLEKDSKQASEKYMYVQEFKTYMADLIDCLTHKSALVEELEDSLMELREDRAVAGRQMVQTLESELVRSAQSAVSAAVGVLGRGGAMAAAVQAAEGAAAATEDDMEEEMAGGPMEVDEFGRNLNSQRQREAKDRRRQRKEVVTRELARLEQLATGTPLTLQEDDWELESEAQAARYDHRHQEIMTAADTVFADAAEEFSSIPSVKQRLEEFKARYPKDYSNTYMHLSTPALFAPFVRLELLHWDPLYADAGQVRRGEQGNGVHAKEREGVHKGFDKQAWYEGLFDYGMGSDPAAMVADDPDGDLVPQLVRKLVLPLATHMISKCWDPLRLQQCKAAAHIVGDLLVYVPAEEASMAELLDGVVAVLKDTAARLDMPPWPPVAVDASSLAKAVMSRRFQSALRFLRGLSVWEGTLSRSLLLQLALDQLVGQQLMPYLRATVSAAAAQPLVAVGRLVAVAGALPSQWFQGAQPPEAKPFIDLLESLAKQVEKQKDQKAKLAAVVGRLATELNRLGSQLQATQLAGAFGVSLG